VRHAVAFAATFALAAYLVAVAPRRTQRLVERLRVALETDPSARLRFYRRYLVSSLLVVAFVAVVVAISGEPVGSYRPRVTWFPTVLGTLTVAVVGILLVMQAAGPRRLESQQGRARVLLPSTREERRLWLLVSLMIGVSEEAVYRGLFVLHLHALAPSLRLMPLAVAAAVAFGIGHRYQGWYGVVGTGLLGLAFGVTTVLTRSLVPAMLTHAWWDYVTGIRGAATVRSAEGSDPLPPPPA
jgi:membrane protease YdiL (CAAX protease family)